MAIKQKIVQKADKSFVDEWRSAWKWISIQAAVVFGGLVAYASSNPEEFKQMVEMLPEEYRPIIVFLVVTVIPVFLRLKKQGEPIE